MDEEIINVRSFALLVGKYWIAGTDPSRLSEALTECGSRDAILFAQYLLAKSVNCLGILYVVLLIRPIPSHEYTFAVVRYGVGVNAEC